MEAYVIVKPRRIKSYTVSRLSLARTSAPS